MKNIPVRTITDDPKAGRKNEPFSIKDLRPLLDGRDMSQELHRHDYYYILILEKAAGHHAIDFKSYPIENHSLFFMRPGQVHELMLSAGSIGYVVQFKKGFYRTGDNGAGKLLRSTSSSNFCRLNTEAFDKLYTIVTNIFREYCDQKENYDEIIRANLTIFFIELLRQRQHSNKALHDGDLYALERLEQLMELLEANIVRHKKVSDYAGFLHLSIYQLNAITRKILRKSASELITEHIILEAKRYLLATANKVNQIAYLLGYDDVSYFIRFFRKHTGYSPDTFRKNFR